MPDSTPDDLVKTATAARLIGTHVSTIHRWIHADKLRAWKRGSRYLVSRADVIAMVQPVNGRETHA